MKKVSFLVLTWFLAIATYAQTQTSPDKYLIKYLESNTSQPDYGVAFLSDNQFVYKSPSTKKINSDSQKVSISNLFIATIGDEGEIIEEKQIEGIPTKKITKTGAAFNKDLKTVYFSAMKYRKKRKINDREQLFKADIDADGNWSNMIKLPFSNDKYSFGEPALSADGRELYFTSDMPSSIGGADIFVVDIREDGNFGKVRNLGPKINTRGNEVTAYISENNKLYFSSDGHPNGLGNLDVYVSDISISNIPTTAVHLDAPINSVSDDFAFITKNDKRGYFASNRLQGQNNHDIYSFLIEEIIKEENCVQEIAGIVKDKETEEAIKGASIVLFDDENNVLQQIETDAEGSYKFTLDCNKTFTIKASGEAYNTEEHIVNTANYLEAPVLEANKFLTKKTESIEGTEIAQVDEEITESNQNVEEQDVVNNVTVATVVVTEEKEEDNEIETNNIDDDEATINPVFFGYDKFNITPKAAKELDKIAKILNNNSNIQIEVSSFTDSRGSNEYNLNLSNRRAKASADYLVGLGVSRSRITTKGYGESKMVNKCIDGVECSEDAHGKNRRTEFAFLNKQVAIETSNSYESKEEEVLDKIVEDTNNNSSVVSEESIVENTSTYEDVETSSDESFTDLNDEQLSLSNSKNDKVVETKQNNSSTTNIEQVNDSQNVSSNSLSEEEMEGILSLQEDESLQEEVVTKTKEPESQRNAFNQLIAEAEAEREQENKNPTTKKDNSTPKELLTDIQSQVVQPKAKGIDKNQVKKTERDDTSLSVSTTAIDAMQSKKGKYIKTDKAKKTHALRVIFRIKENYLATRGAKDAFIVIKSPKGKVISEKGVFTLANGDEQAYTDDTRVFFNSQSIKVVMFVDKIIHKFTKGSYTMNVYIGGHLVGSDTVRLNG